MDFLVNPDIFAWIILPLLIFLARIIDVSLGTIRVIFIARGVRYLAPVIGFFEILIWLVAISQIMTHLNSPIIFLAYAGGFAAGTYVGMYIEDKLSIGKVMIQIIVKDNVEELIEVLKAAKYRLTSINAEGDSGHVTMIFTFTKRKNIRNVIDIIKQYHPKAFYSIEDVRSVGDGFVAAKKKSSFADHIKHSSPFKKGK
ncbi:MAG: DUF2179 domain-containing protein [Candidatus Diapherotrites archaeon]